MASPMGCKNCARHHTGKPDRVLSWCFRCKKLIDHGPMAQPFDRFTPIYDEGDRKYSFNSYGQYVGE